MRYIRNTEETNFWAGYADCMLALFMVALLLWILSSGKTAFSEAESEATRIALEKKIAELESTLEKKKKELAAVEADLKGLKEEVANKADWFKKYDAERQKLKEAMAELQQLKDEKRKVADLLEENRKLKDDLAELLGKNKQLVKLNEKLVKENEKVFVEVSGTDRFTFASGKALISRDFGKALDDNQFADLAKRILDRHGVNSNINDVLEIIGHTDGTKWKAGGGNLDVSLPLFLSGKNTNVQKLKAGSNNDLGLLRALAIRNAWKKFVEGYSEISGRKILLSIKVRCYSAGQTLPSGKNLDLALPRTYAQNKPEFRRIEIRLTNLGDENGG